MVYAGSCGFVAGGVGQIKRRAPKAGESLQMTKLFGIALIAIVWWLPKLVL
jgi:hypothetical protein